MADPEGIAFRRCFGALQTGLQNNLFVLTPQLLAKSFITDGNQRRILFGAEPCDERAAYLVNVLMDRIHIDPPAFYRIVDELDACPALQVLARRLREALERVKGETVTELEPATATKTRDSSATSQAHVAQREEV